MQARLNPNLIILLMIYIFTITGHATAQIQPLPGQVQNDDEMLDQGYTTQDGVVTYTADFLRRYQPNTALDMVRRIPGFTIDDGGDKRGFGGAAGNVLINDRRPSTKQDLPSAILGRISSGSVDRIELIRVKVRDIDLLGQTAVVNVVLKEDVAATIRWESFVRFNFDYGITPFAGISLADRWGDIDYNVGLDYRNTQYGDPGVINRYDPDGTLIEVRDDLDRASGYDINGYFNASTWLGKNFVQLNARAANMPRTLINTSTLTPQLPGELPRQIIFDTTRDVRIFELGLDAERVLRSDLLGKAIILYSHIIQDPSSSQLDLDTNGIQTRFQLEDEATTTDELITRLELDWAGLADHAIQVDLERALNTLDNSLVFTDDTGAGPILIDIPGGNTRVEEVRWNFLVQDTWSLGKLDLNYGLTLERSTLSQSGDSTSDRSFNYINPRTVLTYSFTPSQQTRFRLEREVSQLDFIDFVTATLFEDNNVSLGNPDLRPDRTWIAEASHEQRFGEIGVIKLTAYYHWIDDVLDLLPLSPTLDATGNIGDGRRLGVILETTMPMDRIGLRGARIDFKARWQDSTVVDPVTGINRVLSGRTGYRDDILYVIEDNRYAFEIKYRQDLEQSRVSWGWGLAERGKRPLFRANELDIFNEAFDVSAFIETTRWLGLKIGLEGQNLSNNLQRRDRTIYVGERSLTPVILREFREGQNGARVLLKVSGTF